MGSSGPWDAVEKGVPERVWQTASILQNSPKHSVPAAHHPSTETHSERQEDCRLGRALICTWVRVCTKERPCACRGQEFPVCQSVCVCVCVQAACLYTATGPPPQRGRHQHELTTPTLPPKPVGPGFTRTYISLLVFILPCPHTDVHVQTS